MTELLIVIAVIVLVLAMAIPAMNFLTGSKSTEGATNTISAMLGRARNEAIGLQTTAGVFFYVDPVSNLTTMAIVKDVGSSITPPAGLLANPEVFLDLTGEDVLTLPSGVSVQVVDDYAINSSGQRMDDAYIGFNTLMHDMNNAAVTPQTLNYGGVILFDGEGRLVSKLYAFQISTGTGAGPFAWTAMGNLFEPASKLNTLPIQPEQDWIPGAVNATVPERSSLGLVIFDHSAFTNSGGTDGDPQIDPSLGSYDPTGQTGEAKEESQFLDQNTTLLLINRYNGTIVKGE